MMLHRCPFLVLSICGRGHTLLRVRNLSLLHFCSFIFSNFGKRVRVWLKEKKRRRKKRKEEKSHYRKKIRDGFWHKHSKLLQTEGWEAGPAEDTKIAGRARQSIVPEEDLCVRQEWTLRPPARDRHISGGKVDQGSGNLGRAAYQIKNGKCHRQESGYEL